MKFRLFGKKKKEVPVPPAGHIMIKIDAMGEADRLAAMVATYPALVKIARDTIDFADVMSKFVEYTPERKKARDFVAGILDRVALVPITNKELFNGSYQYYKHYDEGVERLAEESK